MAGTKSLFVPGPTNVPDDIRRAIDVPMEDHRAPDLPAFTLPLFADLKKIFKTETGQVFLFPASGTGGWEAAITNTLNPGDKVLAARFGQFSHLWIDLCQRLGLDVQVVECDWGTGVPVQIFADIHREQLTPLQSLYFHEPRQPHCRQIRRRTNELPRHPHLVVDLQ